MKAGEIMKMGMMKWILVLGLTLAATGCSLFKEKKVLTIEERLTKAGFLMVKGATDDDVVYKLTGKWRGNAVVYQYADPQRGVVFMGGQKEYDRYEQITERQKAKRSAAFAQSPAYRRTIGPITQ